MKSFFFLVFLLPLLAGAQKSVYLSPQLGLDFPQGNGVFSLKFSGGLRVGHNAHLGLGTGLIKVEGVPGTFLPFFMEALLGNISREKTYLLGNVQAGYNAYTRSDAVTKGGPLFFVGAGVGFGRSKRIILLGGYQYMQRTVFNSRDRISGPGIRFGLIL